MKILGKRYNVDKEYFFSSTTYKSDYFDRCIYCHEDVENDYHYFNGEFIGMPYRCNCENALEELKTKEEFYIKINNISKDVDIDRINNITKHAFMCEIERAYDEECEDIISSIVF